MEKILIILIVLNFFLYYKLKYFSKLFSIYDYPDKIRKFHKNKTPLIGGFFLFLNIFTIVIYLFIYNQELNIFTSTKNLIIFFLTLTSIFLLGIYDDKYYISANKKLVLLTCIVFIFLKLDNSLVIKIINFSFLKKEVDLEDFGFYFTLFCFLLFINAFNMFDGINMQSALYALFIFLILLINNVYIYISLPLIFAILFFLYYNYQSKIFLGDAGTHVLGFLISYLIIKSYNNYSVFSADFIFLIMAVPGYELLRLAVSRLLINKHPFHADRNHIHHLILKKYGYLYALIISQMLIVAPIIIYSQTNLVVALIFSFISYCLTIYFFKK
jgi:UDP-GlcNAc:undecaprenyl-phosphate GlcNAc-1-phosphate transferase